METESLLVKGLHRNRKYLQEDMQRALGKLTDLELALNVSWKIAGGFAVIVYCISFGPFHHMDLRDSVYCVCVCVCVPS